MLAGKLFFAPLGFIILLLSFSALPRVHESPALLGSLLGSAALLLLFWSLLFSRRGRLTVQPHLQVNHWIQAIVQGGIYLYWPDVLAQIPLILTQVAFAFALNTISSTLGVVHE